MCKIEFLFKKVTNLPVARTKIVRKGEGLHKHQLVKIFV